MAFVLEVSRVGGGKTDVRFRRSIFRPPPLLRNDYIYYINYETIILNEKRYI